MALRDQPYLPLYVQDFLTDEKLIECSASATGVYVRLMCIMHKSDEYGKILLKQKDKQTDSKILNFANKLAKQMPYSVDVIFAGLSELETEGCLQIEEDFLVQKRMVYDNEISLTRSKSGSKGGKKSAENKQNFATAKVEANSEYEYENVIEDEIVLVNKDGSEKWNIKPGSEEMDLELNEVKGGAVVQMFKFSKNHDLSDTELNGLWAVFKAQNFTGEKYYGSKNEVYSHFINWSKTQNINGKSDSNKKQANGSNYKTAGQSVYAERLKQQLSEVGKERGSDNRG